MAKMLAVVAHPVKAPAGRAGNIADDDRRKAMSARPDRPKLSNPGPVLTGPRVTLRQLYDDDFDQWSEVRERCADWLVKWEPLPTVPRSDSGDRRVFVARCGARERERQLGSAYGFGIFVGSRFAGEINLSSIQRGPFQNAYMGYWIDQALAGRGYTPEAAILALRFAFEDLGLHRVQVSIIPRNLPSRRVAEKLGLREEGTAVGYLEIAGKWENHIRYAITAEEWTQRYDQYRADWLE
ncbi:MAG: GNAT family N-acetyltransferase [Acidimicrobiales bacterium]